LWYGSECADARAIVLDLVVDDGVPSRGHRKGIFNPVYDTVGVAYGPHSTFGRMAALEFARAWRSNETFIRARLRSGPPKISEQAMAKAKAAAGTQWELGTCPLCREQIRGGKVVEVNELGGKLHASCFKCSSCSTLLAGGAFKVQAPKAYCMGCFLTRFGEKCVACGAVITGGTMRCALGAFHPECVVCTTCGRAIGKAPLSTASGALECQTCATAAASVPISAATGRASGGSSPVNGWAGTSALSAVGGAIAAVKPSATAAAKAPSKARAATRPKVSMDQAKTTLLSMGSAYAGLG